MQEVWSKGPYAAGNNLQDSHGWPKKADEFATCYAKGTKQKAQRLSGLWECKALPGKCPKRIKDAYVDLHRSSQWLRSSGSKAETEELMIVPYQQH